jgi:hypothetical protein
MCNVFHIFRIGLGAYGMVTACVVRRSLWRYRLSIVKPHVLSGGDSEKWMKKVHISIWIRCDDSIPRSQQHRNLKARLGAHIARPVRGGSEIQLQRYCLDVIHSPGCWRRRDHSHAKHMASVNACVSVYPPPLHVLKPLFMST